MSVTLSLANPQLFQQPAIGLGQKMYRFIIRAKTQFTKTFSFFIQTTLSSTSSLFWGFLVWGTASSLSGSVPAIFITKLTPFCLGTKIPLPVPQVLETGGKPAIINGQYCHKETRLNFHHSQGVLKFATQISPLLNSILLMFAPELYKAEKHWMYLIALALLSMALTYLGLCLKAIVQSLTTDV